jgi:hypothetical protein
LQEYPNMAYAAAMASFCLTCIEGHLNFADEICRLFDHSTKDAVSSNGRLLDAAVTPHHSSDGFSGSQLQVTVWSTSKLASQQSRSPFSTVLSHFYYFHYRSQKVLKKRYLLCHVRIMTTCTKSHLANRMAPLSFFLMQQSLHSTAVIASPDLNFR